jgi:hypothetical protein
MAPALLYLKAMNWSAGTFLVALLSGAGPIAPGPDLSELREAALHSRNRMQELKLRQAKLAAELDQLGAKIDRLKKQRGTSLLPRSELNGALQRSQELSAELTNVAQALSKEEVNRHRSHEALAAALSEKVRRLADDWEHADSRDERKRVLGEMRSIRAEREQVRAWLPAGTAPTAASSAAFANREDLLEQADALRDSQDKVQQQMRSLDTRIAEARQERELDRKMKDFLREESLFDEQDRRFRLYRELPTPPPTEGVPAASLGPNAQPPVSSPGQSAPPSDRAAQKPPQLDSTGKGANGWSSESLESLQVQREQLRSLAEELEVKARRAEAKARELP